MKETYQKARRRLIPCQYPENRTLLFLERLCGTGEAFDDLGSSDPRVIDSSDRDPRLYVTCSRDFTWLFVLMAENCFCLWVMTPPNEVLFNLLTMFLKSCGIRTIRILTEGVELEVDKNNGP